MSTKIPQDIKDKVKDRADIVDIIGKSVKLTKKGRNHIGCCPFHAEKTASMSVSAQKGIYKCFGCGAAGDVIKFVQDIERISYPEAIKFLANYYHIEIPTIEQTPEEIAKEKQRESVFIVLNESQNQFVKNLQENEAANAYLIENRQLTPEIIERFQIGFAKPENQITSEFPKRGYSFDTLLASGMMGISEKGFQYDTFRSRITFPYIDLHGRPVGFTGRITDNDAKTAKYLNSGDTLVFNKGNVLFGLYQAKEAIIKCGKALLLEGQFDVASVVQHGVENTIAGSGTALTDTQARLLKRFTDTAVLCYDPDNAGLKASIANTKTLLAHGFKVRCILLPEGQDPDDFAKASGTQDLAILLTNREMDFITYFAEAKKVSKAEEFDKAKLLDQVCECISVVPDKYLRQQYTNKLSVSFDTSVEIIKDRIKPGKDLKIEKWQNGFYGIEEAYELMESEEHDSLWMVFKPEDFIESFSEEPVILAIGNPTLSDIQSLRSKAPKLNVLDFSDLAPTEKGDSKPLNLLKNMHKNGFDITIDMGDNTASFCDYYMTMYSGIISEELDGTSRAELIGRCAEVFASTDSTVQVVMIDDYAKKLGLKKAAFQAVMKPLLAVKKDKAMISNQRLSELGEGFTIESETIPAYVEEDKVLWDAYKKYGFYPLADKSGRHCSYMFKNNSSNSHVCVSDFYIKPLLHIYDETNDDANNKRVIQLCHLDKRLDRFVEWKSGIFTNLPKVNEKLFNVGPYNFYGSADQYRKLLMQMSYGFTKCYPTGTLGQHSDGFFVFGNAIFHKVDEKFQIDYVDPLGVVTHEDTNYYLPAFSKIQLDRKNDSDKNRYKLARNIMYKEIPTEKKISFEQWASLMDRVYAVNNNGKWALLYSITCAFRDLIFENRGVFTAPFFIGPKSSGKSEIAESIRNLYMDSKSAAFNLNTGTMPAFFMMIESLKNIPVIMEEYNDNSINPIIFQALKSATYDGEGRIKVADATSKTMDSSDINASIILLGQEAPEKDDGSLATRCFLCDVPLTDFNEEQTEIYEKLKYHEKVGLSNILLQVLELRELYEKHFIQILSEETKKLKESVKANVTNTDGLLRIVSACAMMSSTCRLLETYATHMKLPFTYAEFYGIAEQKVFKQVERISSTNKLSTYFQTISSLITHDRLKIGREIKLSTATKVTRLLSGKKKEEVELPIDTKVLYIDFEGVYSLYSSTIGKDEALSRQSLTAYFNSNQAFIGLTNSTRFQWEVAEHMATAVEATINTEGDGVTTNNVAKMRMTTKQKVTSAYMFNYNILKELVDIDFERSDEPKQPGVVTPPQGDLPF